MPVSATIQTGRRHLGLEDLLLVPLGFAVGGFGTLVGAGGGFILVPVLLFLHPDQSANEITATSLLVVLANSLSGSAAYGRQRRIDYRSGFAFAAGTIPGAIAGAFVVGFLPRRAFDSLFAAVLGGTALWLFFRSGPGGFAEPVTGRGVVRRIISDRYGNTYFYSFKLAKGIALAVAVGFFSSLLGIGGGIIHVPIMSTILHFPVHVAVATSQFVLMFMSGEATIVHVATGTLGWNQSLGEAALIAAGAIPGAQAGAWLGRRVHGSLISRALAASLLVASVRLGLKAIGG